MIKESVKNNFPISPIIFLMHSSLFFSPIVLLLT